MIFKTPQVKDRFNLIDETLREIAKEMHDFLRSNFKLDLVITSALSTEEEDKKLNRVSTSHREGRAFDVSVRTWDNNTRRLFVQHFENKYGSIGAVSSSDNVRRFVVDKNHGSAPHLHIQIGKDKKKKVKNAKSN